MSTRRIARIVFVLLASLSCAAALATDVPFAPRTTVGTPSNPRSVFAADVDGDGDLDVIVGSQSDNTLAWYENDGAVPPTWTKHVIDAVEVWKFSVFAADVDGDGDIDVLAAAHESATITWYENDGGSPPSFTKHVIDADAQSASSVFAADVDGDGDVDVLSANASGSTAAVAWYENNGATPPAFTKRTIGTALFGADGVAAADLDGDGDVDVLAAFSADNTVAWYENNGATPPVWTKHVVDAAANGAQRVFAADIDGDGDVDVLAASFSSGSLSWYENNGATPPAFTKRTIDGALATVQTVFSADVDGDGDLDVLVGTSDEVDWYENDGGIPPGWTKHPIATGSDVASVAAADLDGDGDPDVVAAEFGANAVVSWENRTIHRNAVFPSTSAIATTASGACATATADLDADGDPDVLSASSNDNTIAWYESDGAHPPSFTKRTVDTGALGARAVASADLDGDGDLDVLSASFNDNSISWYANNGARPPVWTKRTVTTTALGATSVAAADVDGDGDVDVVSASFLDNTIAWYENNGAKPPAWTKRTVGTAVGARSVVTADVDGDGDLDIVSASETDNTIAWFENNGAKPPVWTKRTIATLVDGAASVVAIDLDHDGDLDVVSASSADNVVAWYENNGAKPPAWTKHTIGTGVSAADAVLAADLDGDGDVDVVAGAFGDGTVSWFESDGATPPTWTKRTITTGAPGVGSLAAADLDRDGRFDVVSASASNNTVAWYPNRGGQVAFTTGNAAPPTLDEGHVGPILGVTIAHNGRPGDTSAAWASVRLLFEQSPGVPLTTTQAGALFSSIDFYLDDGSGTFDPVLDTSLIVTAPPSLIDGYATLVFPSLPGLQVTQGSPSRYWIAVTLRPDALASGVPTFRITHDAPASTCDDASKPVVLSQQPSSAVASSSVSLVAVSGTIPDTVPIQIAKTGIPGQIQLSWGPSCRSSDVDYDLYEGQLGDFNSHTPVNCSTGGLTYWVWNPAAGNRYFLVAPRSISQFEGSLGNASDGTPRSQGPAACLPRQAIECP